MVFWVVSLEEDKGLKHTFKLLAAKKTWVEARAYCNNVKNDLESQYGKMKEKFETYDNFEAWTLTEEDLTFHKIKMEKVEE